MENANSSVPRSHSKIINRLEAYLADTDKIIKIAYWVFGISILMFIVLLPFHWYQISRQDSELAKDVGIALARLDAYITIIMMAYGGLMLTHIWVKRVEGDKGGTLKKDLGLLFLAAALFCWLFSKLISLYYRLSWGESPAENMGASILMCLFFLLNSWCILQALYYFKHNKILYNNWLWGDKRPLKLFTRKSYQHQVNGLCATFAIIMVVSVNIWPQIAGKPTYLQIGTTSALPLDLLITTPLLFLVLDETYKNRKWHIIRSLNLILGVTILLSQIYAIPLPLSVFISAFLTITMKVVFVLSFVGVAFSWNFEDLENAWDDLKTKELELADQKEAQELELKEQEQIQQDALNEQRIQMNHSTKNTLSLLKLDLNNLLTSTTDLGSDGTDFFNRVKSRIIAAQVLHEELHLSTVGSVLVIKNIINKVLNKVKVVYSFEEDNFRTTIDLPDDLYFPTGAARNIGRLIVELISNICIHAYPHYSPEQRIFIFNVHLQDDSLMIVAQDQGIGFKPESMDQTKGYGLGYIKRIVEEDLKGQFTVQSALGQGSRFTINIPTQYSPT